MKASAIVITTVFLAATQARMPAQAPDLSTATAETTVTQTSGEARAAQQPAPEPLVGGVQLNVEPRRTQVFVDGRYAGNVDNFSGYYHHLELRGGFHYIEMIASGYQPITLYVNVVPNRTYTYRATMTELSTNY
jgi:hypothetical protein